MPVASNRNPNHHHTEDIAFVSLLKACTKQKDLSKASRLHAEILQKGLLEKSSYVGNTLVNLYAIFGVLSKAQEVFDQLPARDAVSWSVLIKGYAQHGHSEDALHSFDQMRCEGVSPNAFTFICILKACGSIGAALKGKAIHAEIIGQKLQRDMFVGSALVDMYVRCGALAIAREVFDQLPVRDVVLWNVMIGGYAQNGHGEEALICYKQMQHEGLSPNAVTFVCILKACSITGAAAQGRDIHAEIDKSGLLEKDIFVGSALVDMYVKCGVLAKAQEVFDQLSDRDVVSWNALIAGYAQHGHGEKALDCFEQMQREGFCPNPVTFTSVLKACGSIGTASEGKKLHADIVRAGLLDKDTVLGNALVDMYAKCGELPSAQEVFDKLPVQDVVSWNVLMAGYAQHGHGDEALTCFEGMQRKGFSPTVVTFISILKACGSIGAATKGKMIHAEINIKGLLKKSLLLGSALVDMYAKCGLLEIAQEVFDELPNRDVVVWNVLIAGYAQIGKHEMVFDSFNNMIREGIMPDLITFTLVLNVCSHAGLIDMGQMCLETMNISYYIIPTFEHYTCMVDLYGRAGHFNKAIALIKKMCSTVSLPAWNALLGACLKWGNVDLGRMAYEHAMKMDEKDAATYICMMNIYAGAGMLEDAYRIEVLRKNNEAWKMPVS